MGGGSPEMKENMWEWHIKSEPVHVRQAVRDIQRCLDEWFPGQSNEERSDLRLIFSELLFNAVLHGNDSDINKRVHIRLHAAGSFIRARITDEGGGYNYAKMLAQINDDSDLYRETGRGLQLVKALVEELSFDRDGRCVAFRKRVGSGGAGRGAVKRNG